MLNCSDWTPWEPGSEEEQQTIRDAVIRYAAKTGYSVVAAVRHHPIGEIGEVFICWAPQLARVKYLGETTLAEYQDQLGPLIRSVPEDQFNSFRFYRTQLLPD